MSKHQKSPRATFHPLDYSPAEREALVRLYPYASKAEILAALPNRAWEGIQSHAGRQGLRRECHHAKRWSAADIAVMRKCYASEGISAMARRLHRSEQAIKMCAVHLGIPLNPQGRRPGQLFDKWPKASLDLVREQYPLLGARTLAKMLNKPVHQLYNCARYLGVRRLPPEQRPSIRPWTEPKAKPAPVVAKELKIVRYSDAENEVLRQLWASGSQPEIQAALPTRPWSSIRQQATRLNLHCEGVRQTKLTTHSTVPKAENVLRPMQVGRPVTAPAPTKRSPNTPILNARVNARLQAGAKVKEVSIVDELRNLPADSEGRKVYAIASRNGGQAGKDAFLQWKQQQAA